MFKTPSITAVDYNPGQRLLQLIAAIASFLSAGIYSHFLELRVTFVRLLNMDVLYASNAGAIVGEAPPTF